MEKVIERQKETEAKRDIKETNGDRCSREYKRQPESHRATWNGAIARMLRCPQSYIDDGTNMQVQIYIIYMRYDAGAMQRGIALQKETGEGDIRRALDGLGFICGHRSSPSSSSKRLFAAAAAPWALALLPSSSLSLPLRNPAALCVSAASNEAWAFDWTQTLNPKP